MFSQYQINSIVLAKVSEIKPYAAFLVFENGCKGMIHISEISDTFVKDIERYLSKGDEVNVLILSIDEKDNFICASYKKVPPDKKYSTHSNVRQALSTTENDFKPLVDKLPEWIEDSLNRHKKG